MKIIETKAPIFIFKMPDKKDEILAAIDSMGTHSLIGHNQQIANSDWHLNGNYHRPYIDIVESKIVECCTEISEKTKTDPVTISNYWFQQYEQDDFHGWHSHGGSVYSSVYYVELPEQTSTTFYYMGKEFQVEVEEGDFLVHPSYLKHCSKPNKTGKRKTVIAFNLIIRK